MKRYWKGGKDEKILEGGERWKDVGRKGRMKRCIENCVWKKFQGKGLLHFLWINQQTNPGGL